MPIYNCEKYIKKTIKSVLNLKYKNYELLLIDDGSTDNTENICLSFNDSKVKYYKKENGGVSSARNYGLNIASGDYVVFLDSDDSLTPDCLDIYLKDMKVSDFTISSYNFERINGEKEKNLIKLNQEEDLTINIKDFSKYFEYLYNNSFFNSPWAKCYKKDLINFEFDINTSLGEDFLFNLSYLRNCNKILITNNITYNYLLNQNGISKKLLFNCFKNLNYVYNQSVVNLKEIFFLDFEKFKIGDVLLHKYIVDFITLIDRNIYFNQYGVNELDYVINKYNFKDQFIQYNYKKLSLKFKIKGTLLINKNYKIYFFITKLLNLIKRMVKND